MEVVSKGLVDLGRVEVQIGDEENEEERGDDGPLWHPEARFPPGGEGALVKDPDAAASGTPILPELFSR